MNVAWYFKSANPDNTTMLARMANGAVVHIVDDEEVDETLPVHTLGPHGWRSAVTQAEALGATIPS